MVDDDQSSLWNIIFPLHLFIFPTQRSMFLQTSLHFLLDLNEVALCFCKTQCILASLPYFFVAAFKLVCNSGFQEHSLIDIGNWVGENGFTSPTSKWQTLYLFSNLFHFSSSMEFEQKAFLKLIAEFSFFFLGDETKS